MPTSLSATMPHSLLRRLSLRVRLQVLSLEFDAPLRFCRNVFSATLLFHPMTNQDSLQERIFYINFHYCPVVVIGIAYNLLQKARLNGDIGVTDMEK
jgi:hypothetical protein